MPRHDNAHDQGGPAREGLAGIIDAFADLYDNHPDPNHSHQDPHQRERTLADLDARDPGAAAILRRMLEAEASGDTHTLDAPLLDLDATLTGPETTIDDMPSHAPELGAKYQIIRPLGFGAHGDVYLAQQLHPVQRDVAIKVLRPSQVRPSTVERMSREARALATLNHPGIATVYEAGAAEDGRPFIATEYVPGEPIDQWCTSAHAPARARCHALALVCRAVEHMHQRGVIHRDLKPTNILVAGEPASPRPKIVDLGIAKILSGDGHAPSPPTITQQGALLGSLGYIAPEQFTGAPADTRGDLYALGRVLERVLDDLEDPWLARHARDSAAIIRRATQPEPDRRYQSAGELADDLEALLDGRPIAARRPSLLEASLRMVRRHKAATLLAVVAIAAIAGGAGAAAHHSAQLALANEAQQETLAHLARVNESQKAMLKDTLDGLVRILGRYPGTRQERLAMAESMEGHLSALMGQNPADVELRVLMARVGVERANIAISAGDFATAESIARRAAGMMASAIDPAAAPVDDLRVLAHAIIVWGDSLHHLGRADEARTQHERARAIHELGVTRFPDHIGLLDDLSWSYDRLGQWRQVSAEGLPQQHDHGMARLALARRLLAIDPNRTLSQYNLAIANQRMAQLYQTHDPAASMRYGAVAAEILEGLLAKDPSRTGYVTNLAICHRMLARVLRSGGDLDRASVHLERAMAVLIRHLASVDPDAKNQLASNQLATNQLAVSPDPYNARTLIIVAVSLADLYEQQGQGPASNSFWKARKSKSVSEPSPSKSASGSPASKRFWKARKSKMVSSPSR